MTISEGPDPAQCQSPAAFARDEVDQVIPAISFGAATALPSLGFSASAEGEDA